MKDPSQGRRNGLIPSRVFTRSNQPLINFYYTLLNVAYRGSLDRLYFIKTIPSPSNRTINQCSLGFPQNVVSHRDTASSFSTKSTRKRRAGLCLLPGPPFIPSKPSKLKGHMRFSKSGAESFEMKKMTRNDLLISS